MPSSLDVSTQHLLRDLTPQVLGAVVRRYGHFAASEDAVQEALIAAATQWPPMVALNHAIAAAMVEGPAAGLKRIDALASDPRLCDHHRLLAVRAHLLERAGDREGAILHYRRAAERSTSSPERDYLRLRAARCAEKQG
jgi:predicted RNA polymerase sigma factor